MPIRKNTRNKGRNRTKTENIPQGDAGRQKHNRRNTQVDNVGDARCLELQLPLTAIFIHGSLLFILAIDQVCVWSIKCLKWWKTLKRKRWSSWKSSEETPPAVSDHRFLLSYAHFKKEFIKADFQFKSTHLLFSILNTHTHTRCQFLGKLRMSWWYTSGELNRL